MPISREEAKGMENDTLIRRFRMLIGTVAADEAVGHETKQDFRTDINILEQEIRDRMADGLNARRTQYSFAVWNTQEGGLARQIGDEYVFITKPDCSYFDIGDVVPHAWDIFPANELAKKEMLAQSLRDQKRQTEKQNANVVSQNTSKDTLESGFLEETL